MPAKNEAVILSFLTRTPCLGSNLKAIYTESGELSLYSYGLLIGRITDANEYLFYDYRAGALGPISNTTSQHCGKLHRLAKKWAEGEQDRGGIAPYSIWSVYSMDKNHTHTVLIGHTW